MKSKVAFRWVVLICMICTVWESSAQEELFTQYKFHRLNESHGLTNNVVNDIIQDSLGQVWVATNEGLLRYRGHSFQQFIKSSGSNNLIHNNFIEDLYLDQYSNVWLMTDDGVGRYSYSTDVITRFLPDQIFGRISSMTADEEDTYYFGRYDGGVIRVKDGEVTALDMYDPVSDIDFGALSILKVEVVGKHLWALVSDDGVIRYNLESGSIVYFRAQDLSGTEKLQQFDLLMDQEGKVWVSTEVAVYALQVENDTTKRVDKRLEKILPVDDYLTMYKDRDGKLWVGSRVLGLYVVDISSSDYILLSHIERKADEFGLSSATVSKVFQEQNGNIWLGTHNGGINIFDPEGELVRLVTNRHYASEYSLVYQNIWGITESRSGNIWVGTDGLGLSLLDPTTGLVENNISRELDGKAILSCMLDSKGRLWVGTYAHGVYQFDPATRQTKTYTKGSDNSDLSVNDIRCFFEDHDGKVYIGTNQGGLYFFEEDSQKISIASGVPDYDIRSIVSTGRDILWLGTFGKGLIKYSVSRDRTMHTAWNNHREHGSDVIFDIYQSNDTLLVATRHNAVVSFKTSNETFFEYPGIHPMDGRAVSAVEKDGKGNIWMTMNSGVAVYNVQQQGLRWFGAEDGFQTGHFNYGSLIYTSGGYMVMGGIHGMNLFYPDQLIEEVSESDIVLNQFKISNKVVTPMNSTVFPEGKSIFLTDKVFLDHSDNIFSIQFSVPGYTTHSQDDFVYMLDGYESKWQVGAESDIATYRNVPPGNYTFKVKSLQNGAEKSLIINIRPPIWKTWPAYIFYLLVIGLAVWRLNRFSNSRIALKQKLKFEQELREKESAVMQEKLRFYTNFSHELKTPLTLIQGPVNDLMHSSDNPQHLKYLRLIRKNTNVILRFINRMLEFRKIEMNKTILNVGNHDLKILAQEEAESFSYMAKERDIKFGFYCQSEIEDWLDIEKIQIVMNNLLSNAFKFTSAGRSVNFGVYKKDNELIIEVSDEGVGINKMELNGIFSPFFQASNSFSRGGTGIGLALSKSFIELHRGVIDVESEEGVGTKFTVRIPTGREKFDGLAYVRFINSAKAAGELLSSDVESPNALSTLEERENEKMLLVVDDNKDIASYIESIFNREYRVIKAENGIEAYDSAVNNTPDVIISDLMMPGMDGLEFCEKIKGNISTSHIPVIMVTAKDSQHDKVKGYEVGVDGYITKPFSSEVLMARVSNLLKNREMLELKYESNDLIDIESSKSAREAAFVLEAEKITLLMLENSDFSVPHLCKELGMSQSALYRKIKSLTGVSIQVFIRKIRIKRAAQLLLCEDMTVTEIAFSLEFPDLKYFRKCFREQFGKNPSEYRAEYTMKADELPKYQNEKVKKVSS